MELKIWICYPLLQATENKETFCVLKSRCEKHKQDFQYVLSLFKEWYR